jgi:hypothetical protein
VSHIIVNYGLLSSAMCLACHSNMTGTENTNRCQWTSVCLFVLHVLIGPNDLFHCSFLDFLGATWCVTETFTLSPDSCQFKCVNMSHGLLEDLSKSMRYLAIGFHFISYILTTYLRMVFIKIGIVSQTQRGNILLLRSFIYIANIMSYQLHISAFFF